MSSAPGLPNSLALAQAFAGIDEHWRPKVAARLNGQELKLVKFQGTFVWHRHDDADELFLGWRGTFRVEFEGGARTLGPGELVVVPKGVLHRTVADDEVEVLIFEPAETRNTGDVVDERLTAPNGADLPIPGT